MAPHGSALKNTISLSDFLVIRMEVLCYGGLQKAAETALRNSGKLIPWQVVTIARDGRILDTI